MACRGHQTRLTSAPKTTAKMILTGNEGRAVKSHARGGAKECALQEVKAEGSSAPRSRGGWAHSVRPSPPTRFHFPPRPGPPHAPSPLPGPPLQKTSLHPSLSHHKTPSAAPTAVSLGVITLNTPRGISAAVAVALPRQTHSTPLQLPHKSTFRPLNHFCALL